MLPDAHRENPKEIAQRQGNLISLRLLESVLEPKLFEQIVQQHQDKIELPNRMDWQGETHPVKFEEAKLNFSQFDQNYLTQLLQKQTVEGGHQNKKKECAPINSKISDIKKTKLLIGDHDNLLLRAKGLHFENFVTDQKRNLKNYQISRYQRVKTIFGHALIQEGYNAPIYNVIFDQTGSYIISGADDGIIKIWDKETMNLQGSLHSHQEVITDMDISKCNQYLASSSKDGKLIIWDWKKCQKLDEIAAHNAVVNNIKFYQLKLKQQGQQQREPEKVQILVTCSDDGTIKIYDEINYINSLKQASSQTQEQQVMRRSRGRHEVQAVKKERYFLNLTPEEYRPGSSRNKKIESINVNQHGLIAAGTNSGEILLWRLDVQKFKKQDPKACVWQGMARKHTKSVHFCEFSPNGKFLFTGSIDGTAKVWNIELEKTKKEPLLLQLTEERLVTTLEHRPPQNERDKNTFYRDRLGNIKNIAEYKQKQGQWQVDCITWSCHGRYAISVVSGKMEIDKNDQDISLIKIWDSFTQSTINDIAKENGVTLKNYSFALAAHPKIEEIFFSGSDGGIICLWNIKQRKLIKKFIEYGVYSFEKYTMNDPYDGKFSPDGSCFVVGSVMGTLSLFSCEFAEFKYEGTRVEQFYMSDNIMHNTNIYYDREVEPQICPYSLIPYEVQPPSSRIGKFTNERVMTNEEYERNLAVRLEMAREEENFIQGQLEEGLRNDFFSNRDLLGDQLDFEEDMIIDQLNDNNRNAVNRGRLNSQLSQISNNVQNQGGSQDEAELLENFNVRGRGRRGRGGNDARRSLRGGLNRRAQRRGQVGGMNGIEEEKQQRNINPNIDPENSFYDRDSDENFEMEENFEVNESEEEESSDHDSDDFNAPKYERQNYHSTRNEQSRENNDRIQTRRQQNHQSTRYQRMQRRQQMTRSEQQSDDENVGGRRNLRRGRRAIQDDSGNESSENENFDMSDNDESQNNKPKRTLKRGANRKIDSDEEMGKSDDSDEASDFSGVRTRRAKNKNKKERSQPRGRTVNERAGRNLRTRGNKKVYDESGSEEDFMDYEEEKKHSQENKHETLGKRSAQRVIQETSESEEVDQDVIVPDQNKKQKGDEDYELRPELEDNSQNNVEEKMCQFCQRSDLPLTGPFYKVNKQSNGPDGPLYFHKDCIEVNNYSFYHVQKQKWMNIGKALEMFSKSSSMCSRCGLIGATIKCHTCSKYYHGYLCSSLYMILLGGSNYQCFLCRNKENYKQFAGKDPLEKQEWKIFKKAMTRDHLISSKQSKFLFVPQVNDLVYYFYQGHEKFISQYNCYFYAGDEPKIKETEFYPWKKYHDLQNPTVCRITSITYRFPSKNTLYLIKRFGKSSNITQENQIVMHIELEIEGDNSNQFSLDLFPNELPNFLILKKHYQNSIYMKQQLEEQGKFVGEIFQLRTKEKQKVRIIAEVDKEKEAIENPTGWESIQYKVADNPALRDRGRRGLRRSENNDDPIECINFWELVLNQEYEDNLEMQGLSSAFDAAEIERIFEIIQDYITRNSEQTSPFMGRVPEKIAPDYRQHISAEMYLELVKERLLNKYYRSQEQLFNDLDLISYNAKLYNGDDNPLHKDAKKMVEKIRCEIKKVLNYSGDAKRQRLEESKGLLQYLKPIGKLTAPPMRQGGPKQSSMDQFKEGLRSNDFEEIKQQNQQYQQYPQNTFDRNISIVENNNMIIQIHIPPNFNMNNLQPGNNNFQQNKFDHEDNSDMKITPSNKIQIQTGYTSNPNDSSSQMRRTRRNDNSRNIKPFEAEQIQEIPQYSTGEKLPIKSNNSVQFQIGDQPVIQQPSLSSSVNNDESQLGKRTTRSGRQTRQMRNNLNEDADDKQFENLLNGGGPSNQPSIDGGNIQTNKRIRQN